MKKLLSTLALMIPIALSAQVPKQDLIHLSVTPQYYFNKGNVKNDGVSPNPLTSQNTTGWNAGLMYQHITKFGLTINYGIYLGQQRHYITERYDLSRFDPEAYKNLSTAQFTRVFDFKPLFVNQKLMLGYIQPIPGERWKGWYGEVRAGLGTKSYTKGLRDSSQAYVIRYTTDDNKYEKEVTYTTMVADLGNSFGKLSANPGKNSSHLTYELYLGLRTDFEAGWIKTMNIGLELTHAVKQLDYGNNIVVKSFDYNDNLVSTDRYNNRDFSIGLHLGFGLWR